MSRGLTIALIASVLVLALGVGGLAAYIFLRPASAPAADVSHSASTKEGTVEPDAAVLKLKNFVTDLSDKDRVRYVDVTIVIGLKDAAALDTAKKLEPQIRDVILGQLRTKVSSDLAGAPGKENLAKELNQKMSDLLKSSLKAVYVTDLVIQ